MFFYTASMKNLGKQRPESTATTTISDNTET